MRYLLGRLACLLELHTWVPVRPICGHLGCGLAAAKCSRCGEVR